MLCLIYRGAYHVFLWSMWWLAQASKLGIVMLLILVPVLLLFWCHVNLMLQRDPCIFWRCSVRMFCRYCGALSIHVFICNYGASWLESIELYFCYKMLLTECLHVKHFCQACCSWSMHAMLLFLPCLACILCVLDGCILSLSWLAPTCTVVSASSS